MAITISEILLGSIILLSIYSYLQIVYESIRKAKNNGSMNEDDLYIAELKQAPGPLPWPILGNLALLGKYKVPFEGFTELAKKFGDVYTLTLGTTRCLVVNSLESIREVLNQNGKFFGGRPDFIRYHKLFGGDRNNSLALCDWSQLQQKRRNLARKHCSPRNTSSYFNKMNDVGCFEMQEFMEKLSNQIEPGKEFHLKPLIMQTCANMFTQYMCSTRFNYEDKEFQTIVRYFDEIFWEINQGYAIDFLPWLLPFYSNHMNKMINWSTTIRQFILKRIINEREKYINSDEPERDFTDALLKSLSEDNNDVSRDTIIFMLEDFIGGHSAIGNLVMMALASIAKNPNIAKNIQNEIDEVTKGQRCVTLLDAENMPYTVATVYEVLRDSSSPIVPHVATEDVAINGYGVTKGTLVFINNFILNKSEQYWDKPNEFNPERFIEKVYVKKSSISTKITETNFISSASSSTASLCSLDSESDIDSGMEETVEIKRLKKNIPHFLPFSIGKRTCIGQNLVKGFGFIMLANIMQSYNISSNNFHQIQTFPACVALPPDTFSLNLTPRNF
ncbi:cytochrome P450 307a1-like [Condylostylus longicornis]|uniref:cytochrome P450 307a1-like n=1 Tax=Condylostylus longicornis TaxID=2530218 RepID=UPI00244DB34F|nr:cytochrome P450 307a1-like [Condylostylus longicornis]